MSIWTILVIGLAVGVITSFLGYNYVVAGVITGCILAPLEYYFSQKKKRLTAGK